MCWSRSLLLTNGNVYICKSNSQFVCKRCIYSRPAWLLFINAATLKLCKILEDLLVRPVLQVGRLIAIKTSAVWRCAGTRTIVYDFFYDFAAKSTTVSCCMCLYKYNTISLTYLSQNVFLDCHKWLYSCKLNVKRWNICYLVSCLPW